MEKTSEAFELLTLTRSNSSADEEPEVRFVKKKPKSFRNRRGQTYRLGGGGNGHLKNDEISQSVFYLPALCIFALGLTIWIFVLTWVAVQLRLEMQTLTNITSIVL